MSKQIMELANLQVTGNGNGPTVPVAVLQDFVADLVATEDAAGGVTGVVIEDSADGTVWYDWITFTALTVTGNEVKAAPARHPLGYVRFKWSGVTGTWTLKCRLSANPLR